MLKLSKLGSSITDGILGGITLVVDPGATPALVGVSGGGHA